MARGVDPFESLTAEWEPKIRAAFLQAVRSIADKASISIIEARLREGDIEGAVRAVGIDPNDFAGLLNTITGAYGAGGDAIAATIPAARDASGALVRILFNIRSPRAEQWAREKSSTLIQQISDDQREMVREHLRTSIEEGVNPRTAALDLVGKIDPKTKRRTGGVIGLTSGQEAWQRAYAKEIASNDPAELKKALARGLRDKRFDGAIKRAIESGEPIAAATQDKMRTAYRNRSLKFRADTIARTEAIQAFGAAQVEAYNQAIDRGQVRVDQLTKVPVSAHDERVREAHREVERLNRAGVPWLQAYEVPAGMAPQLHAPYDEPQCRCREIVRINVFAGLT